MSDEPYKKLAKVLNTLPNGFPETETGIEIKLLKKIFEPDEIDIFCDLKLRFETTEAIAERTGRPLEDLRKKLHSMWERGLIFGADLDGTVVFRMMPWVLGLYEFQLYRMDREFAELCEEYYSVFGPQFFKNKPQLMQVVPVGKDIQTAQESLPYEQVSSIIETGLSFAVADCICKKEKFLLDKGCEKPMEVCMGISPIPGVFENNPWGRPISKDEAYEVLKKSEEAGLVHMTSNVENGQTYICNCCGCCCGVLRSMNELGISGGINAHYYAEIDEDNCTSCGTCAEERCQVNAIEENDGAFHVIRERCIGCGLCISTCPVEAIALVRKKAGELVSPPKDEKEWFRERGRLRGVNFSEYE